MPFAYAHTASLWNGLPTVSHASTEGLMAMQTETFGHRLWLGPETGHNSPGRT